MNSQLFLPLLIVLIAVPLFLQVRKQKKMMQEQQKLQNSLTAGDRVMTTSGLFGTVVSTADTSVDLEIAPGVVTTWLNQAIREKVTTEEPAAEPAATEAAATEQAGAEKAEAGTETSAKQETAAEETSEAKSESAAKVAEPIEKQQTS